MTDRETIEAGLLLLVECGGNSSAAAKSAKNVGGYSSVTFRNWRQAQPETYRRLELAHTNELEDATKSRAQEIAFTAGDLEMDLLAKVRDKLPGMSGKDAAAAARAVADVKVKSIDKWMTLEGRNPEGSRGEEDGWKLIEGAVRSGVFKIAPALEEYLTDDASEATESDATASAASDTPTVERGDAESNV